MVVDPTERPLPGASVVLEGTLYGDAAGDDGGYVITAPPGTYTVRASFLGYRSEAVPITIVADSTVTRRFTLSPDLLQMEEAITTATFNPYEKLESSVAISTLSAQDVETESPQSTADLLKAVPGFYVESSGGEGENNLFARGLPADGSYRYVALQEDGTEIIEPSALDFANPDNFVRLDATLHRVEAVRGGSASTFASDAPGGLVNFVSKTGGPQWGAVATLSAEPHGLVRSDLNVGGPLTESLRMNVGGFYRHDRGLRDPGFTGNRGGQVKGSLTWRFDAGHVRLFGKYLNDRTIFYLPVPYRNPENPTSIPGFDLHDGTLTTDDADVVTVPDPTGDPVTRDLRDGIHPVVRTGGTEVLLDLGGGWSLRNTTRLTDVDHTFTAIVSLDNPVPATAYADSLLTRTNAQANLGATDYRFRYTTSGDGVDDPSALNGNGLVVETGWWYNEKPMSTLLNDLELSKTLGRHSLTASLYLSRFTSEDFRHWHDLLTEVDERPDRLDLTLLNDDEGEVVGRATNRGFRRFGSNYLNHDGTGLISALHLADRWDVGSNFYVELGGRLQRAWFSGSVETVRRTDLDGTPATLFDNQFQTGTGQFLEYDYTFDEWAVSVGLNYQFNDNLALFTRGSRGFRMPNFDQWMASARDETPGIQRGTSETVVQLEGGVKYSAPALALFASGFYTRLDEIPFNDQVVGPGGQTVVAQNFGSSRTIGTEIELSLRPSPHLQLTMRTTIQNPVFTELKFVDPQDGELDFAGNRVKRIPLVMFSAKPTYSLGWLSVFGNWKYVGDRFANNRNTFTLPEYSIVDLGTAFTWRGATLSARLRNVFNTAGLTEGNPRVDETLSADEAEAIDVFMGRPVLPRSLQLSLSYRL
jgi:outer membrane receptor protein involved in Fe transport